MLNKNDFRNLKLGQEVCTIEGPGEWPDKDGAARVGKIYGRIDDRWGFCFRIKFSDCTFDTMHNLNTEKNEGCGYYLI